MKKIVILLISLFMFFSIIGCSNDSVKETQGDENNPKEIQETVKKESEEEIIVVSAPELSQAYEEDETKADALYKGKMVEVEGKVLTRGTIGERNFVILEAIEGSAATGVQCFFEDKAEIAKIEDLREEDLVTIKGEVEDKDLNVRVVNCVFK